MDAGQEADRIRRRRPAAPWTDETRAQLRVWAAEGLTKAQMAARLSISLTTFKRNARGLDLDYAQDRQKQATERGAAVLRAHYATEMPGAEVLALYCAAIGARRSAKRMGEHAFRLRLARPESVLKVKHLAANAAKAALAGVLRVQAAARLQLRLDAGLSLKAAAQEAGHGAMIIGKMMAEGLLTYSGFRRVPARAAKVKALRAVRAAPVRETVCAVVPVVPVAVVAVPVLPESAAPLVEGVEPALPAPVGGVVYASFREIQAWAGFFGIYYDGGNGDRVNRLRAARGLARVVQDEERAA
jgi:hypothetical protein